MEGKRKKERERESEKECDVIITRTIYLIKLMIFNNIRKIKNWRKKGLYHIAHYVNFVKKDGGKRRKEGKGSERRWKNLLEFLRLNNEEN